MTEGFFKGGETWANLKYEGKKPSVSDKLIIDVIGVIKISIQSFTRLVVIRSNSEDLQDLPVGQDGAPHRQRHNLDFVEPPWYKEGSTHESVSQRGRKSK